LKKRSGPSSKAKARADESAKEISDLKNKADSATSQLDKQKTDRETAESQLDALKAELEKSNQTTNEANAKMTELEKKSLMPIPIRRSSRPLWTKRTQRSNN